MSRWSYKGPFILAKRQKAALFYLISCSSAGGSSSEWQPPTIVVRRERSEQQKHQSKRKNGWIPCQAGENFLIPKCFPWKFQILARLWCIDFADLLLAQIIEHQVLSVAKVVEEKLDEEIAALDRLDLDDLEALRERRIQQLKKAAERRKHWVSLGHGEYSEISEKDFFSAVKASDRVVCHFYRDNWPCKVPSFRSVFFALWFGRCWIILLDLVLCLGLSDSSIWLQLLMEYLHSSMEERGNLLKTGNSPVFIEFGKWFFSWWFVDYNACHRTSLLELIYCHCVVCHCKMLSFLSVFCIEFLSWRLSFAGPFSLLLNYPIIWIVACAWSLLRECCTWMWLLSVSEWMRLILNIMKVEVFSWVNLPSF